MQSAKNMSHFGNAHKQSCWMIINNNNAWRKVIFMFPRCFPLYDPKPLYGGLQSQKFVEFNELFEESLQLGQGISVLVVNFIALLELSRESLVEITQAEAYAPIYVRLAYTPQA